MFLMAADAVMGGAYVALLLLTDYAFYKTTDIIFFTRFFFLVLIALQVFSIIVGMTSIPGKFSHSHLKKWRIKRYSHHAIKITTFLCLFLTGYHSIAGVIAFLLFCPVQFWFTSLWESILLNGQENRPARIRQDEESATFVGRLGSIIGGKAKGKKEKGAGAPV